MMETSPWESLHIPNTLIEHKGPGSIEREWWEERNRERERKKKLCFVDRMWEIVGVRGMVTILWVGRIGPEPSLGLRCSHWFPGWVGSQKGRRCGGGKALLMTWYAIRQGQGGKSAPLPSPKEHTACTRVPKLLPVLLWLPLQSCLDALHNLISVLKNMLWRRKHPEGSAPTLPPHSRWFLLQEFTFLGFQICLCSALKSYCVSHPLSAGPFRNTPLFPQEDLYFCTLKDRVIYFAPTSYIHYLFLILTLRNRYYYSNFKDGKQRHWRDYSLGTK